MNLSRTGQVKFAAYEDILLSIDAKTDVGMVALNLVKSCFSEILKKAWNHLFSRVESHTAPILLKLCKNFAISKLDSAEKDPEI